MVFCPQDALGLGMFAWGPPKYHGQFHGALKDPGVGKVQARPSTVSGGKGAHILRSELLHERHVKEASPQTGHLPNAAYTVATEIAFRPMSKVLCF